MHQLTEKELYQIQLSITKQLFGEYARICPKRQKIIDASLKGAINQLKQLGVAYYDFPSNGNE